MSVVTLTISSAGQAIPETVAVVSVDVRFELNRVPAATLVLLDGDIASQQFPVSDGGLFDPGKQVEIKARYEGQPGSERRLFQGVVVRQALQSGSQGSLLRIELRDKAVKLTAPRRSRVLVDTSDSDLIGKLLGEAGIGKGPLVNTRVQHKSVVQYDCSDWDLIVSRAEANGLVVVVADGKLSLLDPAGSGAAALAVQYGVDEVYEVDFECDALGRSTGFSARSWDVAGQQLQASAGSAAPAPPLGRLTAAKAAAALGGSEAVLLHAVGLDAAEAAAWASAEGLRQSLSLVRGRLSLPGLPRARLLDKVRLSGLPKAFAGEAPVSAYCHRIDEDGWVTDLQFGLPRRPFHSQADIVAPAAAGLWPAAGGLQIGIVDAIEDDPDGEYRAKVRLPALGDDAPGCWARLASPDAGKDRGWHFRPEPGDEVVLGFLNQDPRHPVVLGALYGSRNPPKPDIADSSRKNALRGLVTRGGMTLLFNDDDKPQCTLKMPSGASLLLDDAAEAVTLKDAAGNTLTLDKQGITLKTGKDLKIDAGGKVEIKGSQVDIQ